MSLLTLKWEHQRTSGSYDHYLCHLCHVTDSYFQMHSICLSALENCITMHLAVIRICLLIMFESESPVGSVALHRQISSSSSSSFLLPFFSSIYFPPEPDMLTFYFTMNSNINNMRHSVKGKPLSEEQFVEWQMVFQTSISFIHMVKSKKTSNFHPQRPSSSAAVSVTTLALLRPLCFFTKSSGDIYTLSAAFPAHLSAANCQ